MRIAVAMILCARRCTATGAGHDELAQAARAPPARVQARKPEAPNAGSTWRPSLNWALLRFVNDVDLRADASGPAGNPAGAPAEAVDGSGIARSRLSSDSYIYISISLIDYY